MKQYWVKKGILNSMAKGVLVVALSLGLWGCASGNRKDTAKLRSYLASRDYKKAEEYVKTEGFIKDENSRLLRLLEQGTVFYLNGNYYQSLKTFEKAKELSDKLFTVSISKKLKTAVANDNSDNYYGEKYERSMIRFYLSLNHFLLYLKGEYETYSVKVDVKDSKESKKSQVKVIPSKKLSAKERRFHLMGARSILIEWNSLLDDYKSTTGGVVTYKDDLLAKVYGAFVHEQFHTRTDRQVALSLYKEAKNVLLKNFNILKTYNMKADKFKDDYAKLYKLPLSKVESDYISRTEYSKSLLNYLDSKIKQLSKGKVDNVFILLEDDLITEKSVSKIDIPLPVAATAVVAGGKLSFAAFVAHTLSISSGKPLKIYFEVPSISYTPIKQQYSLVIKDLKDKVIKSEKASIVNPLGDLAYVTLDEKKTSIYAKVGARVATKHVAALVASYAIYKNQAKNSEFLALAAASLSYAAANRGIEASESADTRYWSSLPLDYQVNSFHLPKGEYNLFLKDNAGNEKKISTFKVTSKKSSVLIRERLSPEVSAAKAVSKPVSGKK